MFSRLLFEKLQDRVDKGEQTVLLLNKRGHSSFVMCRNCGLVVTCPNCDISMTYHRVQSLMKCHYCGLEEQVPDVCPDCSSDHIRYFGTGTQKVEEELGKLLPHARVIRMDVDTTRRKGAHEALLKKFEEGQADILLGTQMIAKGLDFPKVTLVGVLTADTMLHLPDFRSSEDVLKTVEAAEKITAFIKRQVSPETVVFGPSASPMSRINNRYRYQCLIKYKREPHLSAILKKINETYGRNATQSGLLLSIDVNPFIMM